MRTPSPKSPKSASPTVASLATLGNQRLAELLTAAAKADRSLMRSLSLELAGRSGGLFEEIEKQIARLRTAKGRLDARRATALVRELKGLQSSIVTVLGVEDPAAGLTLLLEFIGLTRPVLDRRSYDADTLVDGFRAASSEVGGLVARLTPGSTRSSLVEKTYRTYLADEFGVAASLLAQTAVALDADGRSSLRELIESDLKELERNAGRTGPPRDDLWKLTQALCDVADADGNIDAFIAAQRRRGPRGVSDAKIAARLLSARRAQEALNLLEVARPNPEQSSQTLAALRIDALEGVGQADDAQTARWRQFQSDLSVEMLRAYLERLPDFDDVEREEAALDWVQSHPNVMDALAFLTAWPDRRRAGALVRARFKALDGEVSTILTPAADALAAKDALAATIVYRLMISDVLRRRRSGGYGHAARHLDECSGLAPSIADWEGWPNHEAFLSKLRAEYARTPAFWKRVGPG